MLGAFTLTLGLLPTIAVAQTPTTPSPTASPQPPQTPVDPSPTTSPTVEPSATPTPDPTEPEQLSGVFTISPDKGKVGTTVTVRSTTPCVDRNGQVGTNADMKWYVGGEEGGPGPFVKTVSPKANGDWSTEITIYSPTRAGSTYSFQVWCRNNADYFLTYETADFAVTGAGKAPVARPVPGNPTYTG